MYVCMYYYYYYYYYYYLTLTGRTNFYTETTRISWTRQVFTLPKAKGTDQYRWNNLKCQLEATR